MTIPYTKTTPHRFDTVGSYLRPQRLHDARHAFEAGTLSQAELTAVEDECIRELVAKQQAAGLGVITDGEFRRATWHLDFMWSFDGVHHQPTSTGLDFHGEQALIDDTFLVGKLALTRRHPFVDHFLFVQALEDEKTVAKLTIPAPAQFLRQFITPANIASTQEIYATKQELVDDLVAGYLVFLDQLAEAGCKNLQIDDCSWGALCDERAAALFATNEEGLKEVRALLLEVNNRVLDGRPEGLTITTHICRGNFHSTYFFSGGYEAVASELFAREHADAFFLEFDSERAGGFEPLAHVPAGKTVVLGLVTTKDPTLEDKEYLKARIAEAAKVLPLDQLALSPQCGFASCEIGNKLTEDEQWAKIALVKEVAEEVWG